MGILDPSFCWERPYERNSQRTCVVDVGVMYLYFADLVLRKELI